MAGAGDLCCQLHVPLPPVLWLVLGPQGYHAPREAGQVAHLVIQDAAPPLSDVGQASCRFFHQMLFYCLKG